jgi:hypothetical protein
MAKSKSVGTVGGAFATTIIFPNPDIVTDLRDQKRNTKKRTTSMNGTLGEKIGTAVEEKHLDRAAFGMACKLDDMDDERLHITFHSLLKYCEDMGVTKRATAQEELFDGGGVEPEAKIVDAKPAKGAAGKAKPKDGDKEANLAKVGRGRDVKEKAGEKEPSADDVFKPLH